MFDTNPQGPRAVLVFRKQGPPLANGYMVTQLKQPGVFAHAVVHAETELVADALMSQPGRSMMPPKPAANDAQ